MAAVAPLSQPETSDAPESGKVRPRTLLIASIGLVLLVVGAVWAYHWWTIGRFIETTDDAYLKADSVTVAPKISGYIAEVYVTDNQAVSVGQPLVRLDGRQYKAILEQTNAAVAGRQADIARGQADLQQQQAAIVQSRAQLRGGQTSAAYASEQVKRYEPLVATGAEMEERLAELRNTRDQSAATVDADTAALSAAERQIVSIQAQIQQARAQLEAAQANARQSQQDMQDTVVVSTLAGKVGDRAVRVGQYVQPGSRLMTIVPIGDLYLEANFKETQLGLMRAGQPATIRVDALPDRTFHGTVQSFAPGTGSEFALLPAQNATGNFTKIVQRVAVRIHLDATPENASVLVPGLSVRVRVDTRGARDAERVARDNPSG
jgi:membrane fusion protein (multidrug efflux system)